MELMLLSQSPEEYAILANHAKAEIEVFLKLLNAQKRAKEQGLSGPERCKAVAAYSLPPQYDPHSRLPDSLKGRVQDMSRRRPPLWNAQGTLLMNHEGPSHQALCSNVSLIDFGVGPLAESEAGDWVQKFGLKTTAITLHTGYWRSFDPDRRSEESDPLDECLNSSEKYSNPFAKLQDWCIEARLKDCCSTTCQAIQQRLEPYIPPCRAWPNFRKWVLMAESCQLSAIANNFLWLQFFNLEEAMYRLEELWEGVRKPDLISITSDIQEIFWFHTTQVQPFLSISDDLYQDKAGSQARALKKPYTSFDIDQKLFYRASQKALAAAITSKICPKRLWDLAFMAPRKHVDMSAILEIVQSSENPAMFAHQDHDDCTSEFCEFADENSTLKKQLHKCLMQSCGSMQFPVEELAKVIHNGRRIAWKILEEPGGVIKPLLVGDSEQDRNMNVNTAETLAISHVWSDGTGVGVQSPGNVNECLVRFFIDIAASLSCDGLWWDTICIPTAGTDEGKKARSIAISKMHENYTTAKHTLIHDQYLLQIDWAEDGSPAVALVLSPWFSRGWTALELSVSSSVKVLYRNPKDHHCYVVKDLDSEILAKPPFARLGHVAASALIQALRGRPSTLMDLLTILSTRSTSWNRDRMAIAGLLARIKDYDYNSSRTQVAQQILKEYVVFDQSLLHHGQATVSDLGHFSWCPAGILLSPQELHTISNPIVNDLRLAVRLCQTPGEYGSVLGEWCCTILDERTVHEVRPLLKHLSVYKVLDEVDPECLVILHSPAVHLPDLLVIATGLWHCREGFEPQWRKETHYIDCHYAGCVSLESGDDSLGIQEKRRQYGRYRFKFGTSTWKKPLPAKNFLQHAETASDLEISMID